MGEGKVGVRLDGTNSIEWVCSLLLMATCSSEIYVDMIFWLKLWVQFDMGFKLNTSWWFTTLVPRLWYVVTFLRAHAELLLELLFLISMYKMSKGAYILSITKLYHCQWDLHIKKVFFYCSCSFNSNHCWKWLLFFSAVLPTGSSQLIKWLEHFQIKW